MSRQAEASLSSQADAADVIAADERLESSESQASRGDRNPGAAPIEPAPQPPSTPGDDRVIQPELDATGGAGSADGRASEGASNCPTSGFNGVQAHVAQAGYHLMGVFGISESDVIGVAARPGNSTSDHPRGLALDFIVDNGTGDALAAYAADNDAALGISYILWQVPDHYDHVHISFDDKPGTGLPC